MTQYNIGRIRFSPQSTWTSGNAYVQDDVVIYNNGFYSCTVANSSTTTPALNTSQWTRIGGSALNFTGEWSSSNAYVINDVVTYTYDTAYNSHYNYSDTNTYICIAANTNQNPLTATSSWSIISKGKMRDKFAYLGGTNEGYIPPSKSNWDNLALAAGTTPVPVGMGDSFGEFKTPGTHVVGINGMVYVNRRFGLMTYGNNNNNQNGSTNSQIHVPTEATFANLSWFDGSLPTSPSTQAPRILQVESDHNNNMLVLFDNGEVHYCGLNDQGQRGDGTTDNYDYFTQCGYANVNRANTTTVLRSLKAIRIASTAGGSTSTAVSNYALVDVAGARTLYGWGYNLYGQLGLSDTTARNVPTAIPFNQVANGKIIEIWATGGEYGQLFILTDQGNMFACGYNGNGNLGIGNTTANITSLTLVKAWGTGTSNYIKKFNTQGGTTGTSFVVIRGDGTLWTWGFNGYGQLGMNHTNNVALPIQVYAGGYSGASNPVTTSGNAGTPIGAAITTAWNAWMCGGNGYGYLIVTTGSSDTSNNAYSTGYNGNYNLSVGLADNTNRSVLTLMQINNGSQLANVIDVSSNNGQSGTNNTNAVLTTNNEWYFNGYNNGCLPIGHNDSYNARQIQDPNYLSGNYRLKNNAYWPTVRPTIKQRYYKCVLGGLSTSKWIQINDLYSGRVWFNTYNGDYSVLNDAINNTGLFTPQKIRNQ